MPSAPLANPAAPPLVLTIAGFDPTSGAGITADIKTFAANQCYGLACITALTIQDSRGAHGYKAVAAATLEAQLGCLLDDLAPRALKIGMLANRDLVEAVARQIEAHPVACIVLDPIHTASSGARLVDDAGWNHLRKRLLPLVSVVTPNLAEAERLSGLAIAQTHAKAADMEAAARAIAKLTPAAILITGGHLDRPVDLLYHQGQFTQFAADRVKTNNTHGTGCTFSAALAANLALGKPLPAAVVQAKAYLTAALKQSYPIGPGPGPLNHLYRLQEAPTSRNVDPAPLTEFTTR